jgi:hypothetical protein
MDGVDEESYVLQCKVIGHFESKSMDCSYGGEDGGCYSEEMQM